MPAFPCPEEPGLRQRLGLSEQSDDRLSRLPVGVEPVLPDSATSRDLMTYCAIDPDDRDAMLDARPDPERDPELWWLLRGTIAELRANMDTPLPAEGYQSWPTIPLAAGPVGLWLYAWSLLSVVPDLRDAHRRRGIAEQITHDTVVQLGAVIKAHHDVTGYRGLGLFPLWGPPQVICGCDFSIGRHDFTRSYLAFGDGPAGWALQVHIPPKGALVEFESIASIAAAEEFFGTHFPDEPIAALVCKSWILDPQLADYLGPDSNLVRFQSRFTLLPHVPLDDVSEGDREMMRLGLQLTVPEEGPLTESDLARIPRTTTLSHAFVSHIRAGRHWHKRTGIAWRLPT